MFCEHLKLKLFDQTFYHCQSIYRLLSAIIPDGQAKVNPQFFKMRKNSVLLFTSNQRKAENNPTTINVKREMKISLKRTL